MSALTMVGATRRPSRRRRLLLTAAALFLVGVPLMTSASAGPAGAAAPPPAYSATKTLTRDYYGGDGSAQTDNRTVTVNVDRTTNLRGREVVQVSWSGAHPTGGRTLSPYSLDGMGQEYPVLILECRGKDDPSLPADQQISPQTCFTTSYTTRFGSQAPSNAVWEHDAKADSSDRVDQSQQPSWPADCTPPNPFLAQHLMPFIGANGTTYLACNEQTESPDMAIGAAFPPNDLSAYTKTDGTGEVGFEVRTGIENQSLGCSNTVPCAIVVIPIMGVSCADTDSVCNRTGQYAPGSLAQLTGATPDIAVTARFWWSASNWQNRFVVPLTFQPPPNTCDVLDSRAPVDFLGSAILTQAALQWSPAYCLRQDRFKFRHDAMPEGTALRTLLGGSGAAALLSNPGDSQGQPLAYAPVAVSGWGIGFVADRASDGGEATELKLNARLLAKLMTDSYPGSTFTAASAADRPDLAHNPFSINLDPEFVALNPGLSTDRQVTFASLLSLSVPADVIHDITEYINSDPAARSFLDGTPDPWGMTVNSQYKGIQLPVDKWPALDGWVRPSNQTCDLANPAPWFGKVDAPISDIDQIAQDVLDAWPTSTLAWSIDPTGTICKSGRVARLGYGSRLMLGVVAIADADRYGVRLASLQTSGSGTSATFVPPTNASMAAAVGTATIAAPGDAAVMSAANIAGDPDAYPGTMVVHVVASLSGLDQATAGDVADFVDISTTEGQVQGTGVGQLPAGYLPITSTGTTAPLLTAAQLVSKSIRAQQGGILQPTPTPTQTSSAVAAPSFPPVSSTGGGVPSGSLPGVSSAAGTPAPTSSTHAGLPAQPFPSASPVPVSPGATPAITPTSAAGGALPAALGVAVVAGLGAPLVRRIGSKKVGP